ncbi:PE family protein [Mycobacterium kubicae]|uniref:PE family protein n=1 Tax=Mycobacterium kubicae TaxID=120959 RepID=UPI001C928EB5|nr:PE family protein [Mycobacterium kubicae]
MSYVIASPEYVAAAAADLARIATAITDANTAAAVPTSSVLSAGVDEVSILLAALFDEHAQAYQALSAQAEAFHNQFVQLMTFGGDQYALSEAANNSTLQVAEQGLAAATAPAQALSAPPPALGVNSTPFAAAHPVALGSAATAPVAAAPAVVTPAPAAAVATPLGPAVAATSAVPASAAGPAVSPVNAPVEPLPTGAQPAVGSPVSALPANLATRAAPTAQPAQVNQVHGVQARAATAD